MEVSGVEPLVEVSLDQQGDSLRGPLAVRVLHGHPPPRMVLGVMGLVWLCCGCSAPGSRAPYQWRGARLPGLWSWVCVVEGSHGKGWECFTRSFAPIYYTTTTVTTEDNFVT